MDMRFAILFTLVTAGWLCCGTLGAKGEPDKNNEKTTFPTPDTSVVKVGDRAPDFTLPGLDGQSVTLSSYQGKKPVFIVFGSYS